MRTLAILLVALSVVAASCGPFHLMKARSDFKSGVGLFNQGSYDEAIPYFQRAIGEDPDFASAYLYLGRCYLNLGMFRQSIQPLRTAFSLAPGPTKKEAFNLLTDALLAAGFPEESK